MSDSTTVSSRSAWAAASIGIAAAIAVVAIVIGFIWQPLTQSGEDFQGVWDAICGAAGIARRPALADQIIKPTQPGTRVEIVPEMLEGASAEAIGRGATLALRCTMCHGARGLSEANSPNLAGQYAVGTYKQLVDFKTGARASAVMAPLMADLSDTDMRELAAYFAYLPRTDGPAASMADAPAIVAHGAPMRGVAPCGACHGQIDHKAGATWLGGQPIAYLRAQLSAFALSARHNDIGEQMRNVARHLTPDEIDAASRYYAGQ